MKVILITGASSGIGGSAARMLLAKGHTVYCAARRTERMQPLAVAGARLLRMDVTDEASMDAGIRQILEEQGHIDVLVNNAGYGYFGPMETVSDDEARRQFEVNVFGLASLCRKVLPLMRGRGEGRIINVASMAGHFCEPRGDWYHATKYAVVALSECLRMEVRPFGIKVSLIEPGAIRSEWCDIAMDNMLDACRGTVYEKGAEKHSKMFRWAYAHFASSPDVIAKAICHASDARRPRLHYRKGFGSVSFPLMAKLLPARWFDALLGALFG